MRNSTRARFDLRRATAAVACLAIATLGATGAAARPRACVRAAIEEPFLLPDGSRHPRGLLRICLERTYSPTSGLHTIVVGDGSAGGFLSRREWAEVSAELRPPRILFVRDGSRTLSLLGYTVAAMGRTEIYWIAVPQAP